MSCWLCPLLYKSFKRSYCFSQYICHWGYVKIIPIHSNVNSKFFFYEVKYCWFYIEVLKRKERRRHSGAGEITQGEFMKRAVGDIPTSERARTAHGQTNQQHSLLSPRTSSPASWSSCPFSPLKSISLPTANGTISASHTRRSSFSLPLAMWTQLLLCQSQLTDERFRKHHGWTALLLHTEWKGPS